MTGMECKCVSSQYNMEIMNPWLYVALVSWKFKVESGPEPASQRWKKCEYYMKAYAHWFCLCSVALVN